MGALGIVYGDLGTSPLYALNEVFFGSGGLSVTAAHAAGVASIIFWMLVLIIGLKYATFVLRADHEGEGGVFALLSLIKKFNGSHIVFLSFLLMFAAGLLFGDGIITPAISVLSAIEGLKLIEPGLASWVVPITVVVLAGIFFFQKKGTSGVGKIYGPIMLAWFVALALLGIRQILSYPGILILMINPLTAIDLASSLDWRALMMLSGAVFLVLTGSEALYADLGHLGRRAIRIGWFAVVFPSLALNYAGQGAYIMSGQPIVGQNLFYSLTPEPFLPVMIVLATAATIIASVALIFGAYSLASQAIALHLLPRLRVVHTNRETEGQIYLPAVNWALFIGSVSLVIGFGSATRLAAAYGFAVSGVMLVTTMAMFVIATREWRWQAWHSALVFGAFSLVDLYFITANSAKFLEGGYIPFFLGCAIFIVIATWRWGRHLLRMAYDGYVENRTVEWFLSLKRRVRESGGVLHDDRTRAVAESDRAVVFLISRPIRGKLSQIPVKLRVYLKRRGVIPKNILFLNIEQERVPYLKRHYQIIDLGQNVFAVHAVFGFMENPNATRVLRDLYHERVFEDKFRRCTIEVSEDEFIIDEDVHWTKRWPAIFFRRLLQWSVPRYRYFGLAGEASAGLAKTVVPVRLSPQGIRVEIPEFPLISRRDTLDPDTLRPTDLRFTKV